MQLTAPVAKKLLILTTVIAIFFVSSVTIHAKVGVGMGAGEIRVTESIKPGGIYSLPALRVFNTGDETTTYGMNIAYHQDNLQIRPEKSWFTFTPATFTIDPGESQEIQITMTVPVKAEPGEYFTFLESGPVAEGGPGTSVGVAVATKLYFSVVYANLWQAFTYRASDFLANYAPWSWICLGGIGILLLGSVLRRFFSFNVSVRKKDTQAS